VLLVALVAVAVLVRTFLVAPFSIPSASMEPGLRPGDRIVVSRVSTWGDRAPERGDVVVFEDPGGWLDDPDPGPVRSALGAVGLAPTGGHLVKRVVGVAGDTIRCCDDRGRLVVNGVPVDESGFLADRSRTPCDGPMVTDCDWTAGPVPEGALFVMGDNRGDSDDSSAQLCRPNETDCTRDPYVEVDEVVGRVAAVVWPLDRVGGVPGAPTLAAVPEAGRRGGDAGAGR